MLTIDHDQYGAACGVRRDYDAEGESSLDPCLAQCLLGDRPFLDALRECEDTFEELDFDEPRRIDVEALLDRDCGDEEHDYA